METEKKPKRSNRRLILTKSAVLFRDGNRLGAAVLLTAGWSQHRRRYGKLQTSRYTRHADV